MERKSLSLAYIPTDRTQTDAININVINGFLFAVVIMIRKVPPPTTSTQTRNRIQSFLRGHIRSKAWFG
jgi:hypothetical protein